MAPPLKYVATEYRDPVFVENLLPWLVREGAANRALFYGPDAESRAKEYAAWKNAGQSHAHAWEQGLPYSILRGWVTAEFLQAWAEWVAHRREIRHKLTERGARLQLQKFKGWTQERAIAAIRHSITQGYRGIFEPPQGRQGPEDDLRDQVEDFLR